MTGFLTPDDAIAAIPGLTRQRLLDFIAAEVVIPLQGTQGPVFRPVEIARLRLLCELTDDLTLDEGSLVIVMGLLDQLHATRLALRAIARAIADAPDDLRAALPDHHRAAGPASNPAAAPASGEPWLATFTSQRPAP